jgi:hypothetical protein
MFIKHIPVSRIGEITAQLVREGVTFVAVPEDDSGKYYIIEFTGGY